MKRWEIIAWSFLVASIIFVICVLWNEGNAGIVCVQLPTATPTPTATPAGASIELGGNTYYIASHPRLTTPTRVAALQARSVTGKTLWDLLVTNNDSFAGSCTNPTVAQVPLYSLAVGILSDPTKSSWKSCLLNYFRKIKDLTTSYDNNDYGRMDLMEWAFEYDVLYPDLTATERSNFLDFVFNTWIPYLRTHSYDVYKGTGDCVTEPRNNLCVTSLWGQYIMGLACAGEDSRCNDLVEDGWAWWHDDPGLKADFDTAYAGGHTPSGTYYGRKRVLPYILEIADAETTALGMSASWMSWMNTVPKEFIHAMLPEFTKTGCPFTGDVCAYFSSDFYDATVTYSDQGSNMRAMLLPLEKDHASTVNQQAQYWLVNDFGPVGTYGAKGRINPTTGYGGKEYLPEWHLRYDQDATASNFNVWDTAYLATGTGEVFSRDAWGNGDRVFVQNQAPTWFGDHQTPGCGSVRMFKNGEWGIVENDPKYAAGATDHNASPGKRSTLVPDSSSSAGQNGYGEAATCTIPWISQGASYAVWQDNLDGAYTSSYPVAYARRNFFHLKPLTIGEIEATINYLVVLDAVDPTNSITWTQQFYVPKTSPTVSDPDVSFSLTDTKTMIRRIYPTSGATISANSVTDASGTADEYCVQCGSGMNKITNLDTASASAHFLGVVISMQGTSGSMPTTTAINGASNGLLGVQIDDASGIKRFVLAPAGTSTVSGTFTVGSTATTSDYQEWVISGLTAGQKYDHTSTGSTHTFTQSTGGEHTVDANGVLRFTELGVD